MAGARPSIHSLARRAVREKKVGMSAVSSGPRPSTSSPESAALLLLAAPVALSPAGVVLPAIACMNAFQSLCEMAHT